MAILNLVVVVDLVVVIDLEDSLNLSDIYNHIFASSLIFTLKNLTVFFFIDIDQPIIKQ